MNKVLLMGNLTRDPRAKYTTGGMAVCGIGLAVNRRYTNARGEPQEETCFVDIDVFGKQAESCERYLRKGSPVLVEGRLKLDQWDDKKTGQKRSQLRVTAERVQFLGQPRGEFGQGPARGAPPPPDAAGEEMPSEPFTDADADGPATAPTAEAAPKDDLPF
jgi:single-strand DNA-binding protein